MIHHFFATAFLKRFADSCAKGFQYFLPRGTGPLPCSASAVALHGIQHAIWIVNLIDGCRTFGAQASAACGMHGITFEFGNLTGCFVDIGQQTASRFAVETNRRNQGIVLLDTARPGFRIEFNPVVPLFHGRTISEMAAVAFKIITHFCLSTPGP